MTVNITDQSVAGFLSIIFLIITISVTPALLISPLFNPFVGPITKVGAALLWLAPLSLTIYWFIKSIS